jgi:hypothetical protein
MTHDDEFIGRLEQYLDDYLGQTPLPDGVRNSVRAQVPRTGQVRSFPGSLPVFGGMSRFAQMATVAAVAVAAVGLALALSTRTQTGAPTATPSPTPTLPPAVLGASGTRAFPGTFITNFQPALRLTIDTVVDLDCPSPTGCWGSVDVNEPDWIDLEFGTLHGAEIDIIRMEKVFDPALPGVLIDPPEDLAAWVAALPATAKLHPPTSVVIGGLPAIRFDVASAGELQLGPIGVRTDSQAGIGPRGLRITLLRVSGHLIVITEWLGPQHSEGGGRAVLDGLQPLVDSIHWS